jgi:hypothetical protein
MKIFNNTRFISCNPFYITVVWKHNDVMLIEISYMVTQSSEMN